MANKPSLCFSRYAEIPALQHKFLVKLYIPIKPHSYAPDPRYVSALDQVIGNIDKFFDEYFKEGNPEGDKTLRIWYKNWYGGTSDKHQDQLKDLKRTAVITSVGMASPMDNNDVGFWIDYDLPSPKLDGNKDAMSSGHCLFISNGKVMMDWQGYSN